MARSLQRSFFTSVATLAATFAVSTSSLAWADGRIAAGAVIPLDVGKAADSAVIQEIIGSCMYEEAMKGMFPDLVNVDSGSGTTKTVVGHSMSDDQRSRSGTTTTTTSLWEPRTETALNFDEMLANGTTVKRDLSLTVGMQYGQFSAAIATDYNDLKLSAYLTLPLLPAQLQVVSTGGKSCSTNNWGRNICVETPPVMTAVNLLIPTDFVAGANWMNSDTGVETQKRFDYFNYADCILWKWEH